MKTKKLIIMLMVLVTYSALGQQNEKKEIIQKNDNMKTYLIERNIPNAGDLTQEQLKGISQTSCTVLKEMGSAIEWQHSYVTGDKVYCVYRAESKDLIEEHAKKGGFPANNISEVAGTISPATAQ